MTKVNEIVKTDTNTEVTVIYQSKDWEDIEDIEVPNYVNIMELVHDMSICCDNLSELICKNNEHILVNIACDQSIIIISPF